MGISNGNHNEFDSVIHRTCLLSRALALRSNSVEIDVDFKREYFEATPLLFISEQQRRMNWARAFPSNRVVWELASALSVSTDCCCQFVVLARRHTRTREMLWSSQLAFRGNSLE